MVSRKLNLRILFLRDRIHLSEEGILVPVIVLHSDIPTGTNEDSNVETQPTDGDADNTKTALNTGQIEIISRGFVYMDKSEELIEEAKEITRKVIGNLSDEQMHETEIVQDEVRGALRRFFSKQMQRTPLIFPVVMRV